MSGNNCDDAFQQAQQLQEDNRRLQQQMDEMQRQMRAAGVYSYAPKGDEIILPGANGVPKVLDTADVKRGYKQLAGTMTSGEVDGLVSRGINELARPTGADGRFQNYDRILREVDIGNVEDYARLAEALGITLQRIAPDDFALITQTYGKERILELVSNYYRNLGASDVDILARAAAKTAPVLNAVENKVWLRFWADRSKRTFLDTVEEIRTYMNAIPGAPVPPELKQQAFKQYKLALALERHNNLVSRRHAQALRSQQEILGLEQFRLDVDDDGKEVADALGLTGKDIDKDSSIGRVLQAVDDGGAKGEEQLRLLIDAVEADGLDPKSSLDKDWFNTHMRMSTALVKDSQLGNLQTQAKMNLGSNAVMFVFGPVEQTFYNGAKLTPVATQLTRAPLLEAARISSEAHTFAWTALQATWRRDLSRVFQEGVSHYSGNLDTYGKKLLTNEQEFFDLQKILDTPYMQGSNPLTTFANPHNIALFTNKLQVAARILAFTKPGGTKELTRLEAAFNALSLGPSAAGRQQVRIKDVDTFVPWKPFLRTMAGVDEVFGKYHYLFKLKADLEVKARMEGAQLGLLSERDRAEWVQARIDEAVYQATPTEENIKAFRKQNKLKGSDFTDDEIGAMIAENNLAGAPTLGSQESVDALQHSARMRMQDAPTGNPGEILDRSMMSLRQNWMVDRYLMPYWRSPFMGMMLDVRNLAPIVDTAKLIGGPNPSPELVAKTKAAWVMSVGILAAFGMLDAAGMIRGGYTEPDPARRNTIKTPFGWIPFGGLPVLNTLFLWKDLKEGYLTAKGNDFDGQTVGAEVMKVLTGHIMRQTGLQTVQLLMTAMVDGSERAWENLRKAVAFMGSGQIPFVGAGRNLERLIGADRNSYFRDGAVPGAEAFTLGQDHPLAQLEKGLKELAYDTLPVTGLLTGAPRKTTDHLGTPKGHVFGIDLSKALPFFPGVWPSGKINETVYPELDAQDRLDPPTPLLTGVLDGIAMSDDLQAEYNDIHGKLKGDRAMPPTARMSLAGKTIQAQFPLPVETVTSMGIRIRNNGTASIPLGQVLDAVTAGRTKKEALYELFTSPWYQQVQDDPRTSTAPPGGLPPAERRRRVAQVLIKGINDYYDLGTRDELERRAASGASPAAKEWSDAKTELANKVRQRSLSELEALGGGLRNAPQPAQ